MLHKFIDVLIDRSMQGGPDWTCVLVGFTSGYVRMYTEVIVAAGHHRYNVVPSTAGAVTTHNKNPCLTTTTLL